MTATTERFDWYQSDSDIYISYFRKDLNPSNVRVDIKDQTVSIFLITASGDELLKQFKLAHNVNPQESTYRASSVKIEVRLRKTTDLKWNFLEAEEQKAEDITEKMGKIAHSYPSSSKNARDWNKIEKEAAEIEDEEDPLNKLFKNIYAGASDETRRAMIKSFTESGGTVLSTNWDEVGKGKVEMKPPDGMEFKRYEI